MEYSAYKISAFTFRSENERDLYLHATRCARRTRVIRECVFVKTRQTRAKRKVTSHEVAENAPEVRAKQERQHEL